MGVILTPDELVSDYIIQLNMVFRPGTTNILGSLNLWKKAGYFGSGDELLKFCPANGCKGFFTDTFDLTEREKELVGTKDIQEWPPYLQAKYENWFKLPVMCDKCGTISIRETLPDSYGFNMGSSQIAERMAEFFTLLSGNADIYMVRTKEDKLFHQARQELHSVDRSFSAYQKKLEKARNRDCVLYLLKSIMADTASGGDLTKRIKALIEA